MSPKPDHFLGAPLGSKQVSRHRPVVPRSVFAAFLDHHRAERSLGLDPASLTIANYHSSFGASILRQGPYKDGYLAVAVDVSFILSAWLLAGQALAMRKRLRAELVACR